VALPGEFANFSDQRGELVIRGLHRLMGSSRATIRLVPFGFEAGSEFFLNG
jgi:hypothetical protein